MNSSPAGQTLEKLDEGVVLKQIDDLCFVHFSNRSVNAAQTRQMGLKLIGFLERVGCRKLVMSFAGVESIYGFLIDNPPLSRRSGRGREGAGHGECVMAGSDLWVG